MSSNPLKQHILIIPSGSYVPKEFPYRGIFQQDQAKALNNAGYKIGVISLELRSLRLLMGSFFGWKKGIHFQDDQGIPVYRYYGWYWIPRSRHGQVWLFCKAGMKLFKHYIRRHGIPEAIHVHNALYAGVLANKIKRKWHIPYVITEHSTSHARGNILEEDALYIKNVFENADKRIVVSPNLGHVLEKLYGDTVRPWVWVPNILNEIFEKNYHKRNIKKRNAKSFIFFNTGSLREKKGQADLLYAFAEEFAGASNVKLKIAGGGPLLRKLEMFSKELDIENQVSFLGILDREQLLREMQACDIYVQSSHYETFGIALIEALSCGKPVIATACGGPECIIHKGNGLLVSTHDIAGIRKAMVLVKENIGNYDSVLIAKDCIERYGKYAIISQLSNIYQDV